MKVWARRVWTALTRPGVSIVDGIVAGSLYWTLTSDGSRWWKAAILVPILAIGATSFWTMDHWWKPKARCEVRGCRNSAGGQTAATNIDGKRVYRSLCEAHWEQWRKPNGRWSSADERDKLMRKWGWRGEAWWRD